MDSNNPRSPSVLIDRSMNIQNDAIKRTIPFRVSNSLKNSPASSFGSDEENKPPVKVEDASSSTKGFVVKIPLSMPNGDCKLNSLIDGLTHLKIDSTPVQSRRFNFSKWTTPLKQPAISCASSECSAFDNNSPSPLRCEEVAETTLENFSSKKSKNETGANENDDAGSIYFDCDEEVNINDLARSREISNNLNTTADSSFYSVPDEELIDDSAPGSSTFVQTNSKPVCEANLAEMNQSENIQPAYILEKYLIEQDFKLKTSFSDVSFYSAISNTTPSLSSLNATTDTESTPSGSLFEKSIVIVDETTEHDAKQNLGLSTLDQTGGLEVSQQFSLEIEDKNANKTVDFENTKTIKDQDSLKINQTVALETTRTISEKVDENGSDGVGLDSLKLVQTYSYVPAEAVGEKINEPSSDQEKLDETVDLETTSLIVENPIEQHQTSELNQTTDAEIAELMDGNKSPGGELDEPVNLEITSVTDVISVELESNQPVVTETEIFPVNGEKTAVNESIIDQGRAIFETSQSDILNSTKVINEGTDEVAEYDNFNRILDLKTNEASYNSSSSVNHSLEDDKAKDLKAVGALPSSIDSIFKTPVTKRSSKSELSAINDSSFNADYCSARVASADSIRSREVPPSLPDMSIGSYKNCTATEEPDMELSDLRAENAKLKKGINALIELYQAVDDNAIKHKKTIQELEDKVERTNNLLFRINKELNAAEEEIQTLRKKLEAHSKQIEEQASLK